MARFTVTWQEPIQSVLALRSRRATDLDLQDQDHKCFSFSLKKSLTSKKYLIVMSYPTYKLYRLLYHMLTLYYSHYQRSLIR